MPDDKGVREPESKTGEPVPGFPMTFEWYLGDWELLFNEHTNLIRGDLRRARAEDRMIVYLSCPISSRGGGHADTNVELANFTARRLMMEWGPGFFILNPAQYQLESKEGTGLIKQHADRLVERHGLEIDVEHLMQEFPPKGGDYMRMWTQVLVEDGDVKAPPTPPPPGAAAPLGVCPLFDAFYFLSPVDVRAFFADSGARTVLAGVEDYFARKLAVDPAFQRYFLADDDVKKAKRLRRDFLRFYSFRAGAAYSRGCHDEWNIWVAANRNRRAHPDYGAGSEIPGFFNGLQIDPAAAHQPISPGYAV